MTSIKPSILVVDDTRANLTLMSELLQDTYKVKAAPSGEKALKIAFSDNPPDLILLDIMMPEMDGYEVCRQLKGNSKTKDIPVIFLTAMSQAEDEEMGLALGAVDYITKPLSPPITLARIKTHITMYQQKKALMDAHHRIEKEISEAADYIQGVLPSKLDGDVKTEWIYTPSSSLGGDAFGYHAIDKDHFAIYLLDVCGHGVGSALMSVSAINSLRSQSLKQANFKSPSSVLSALNNAFLMEEHNNKFFTVWYGVYSRCENILRYASSGHPPAILISSDSNQKVIVNTLSTNNITLGFFENHSFTEDFIQLKQNNKLYVFSDGVYEIEQSNGVTLTFSDFKNRITDQFYNVDQFQSKYIYLHMQNIAGIDNHSFEDDFSMLEILLNAQTT